MSEETCGAPENCICGMCDKERSEPDYIDSKNKELKEVRPRCTAHNWDLPCDRCDSL